MKYNFTKKDFTDKLGKEIYNQFKAKIFNVLESQIEREIKLKACKKITEDIIDDVVNTTKNLINFIVSDFNYEIIKNCETCDSEKFCCYDTDKCKNNNYEFFKPRWEFLKNK